MSNADQFQANVLKALEGVAELQVSGAFGATTVIWVELLKMLMDKNVVSWPEVEARLSLIEAVATSNRSVAPTTNDYILRATLSVRDAFRGKQEVPSKPN